MVKNIYKVMICFLHRRNVSWWTAILTVLTGSAKVLDAPKRRHMDCKKFEWLTEDICKEYQKRADMLAPNDGQDTGAWRDLRIELQERCNITEVMAINILHKRNVGDYCRYYGILSGAIPMPEGMKKKLEKDAKKKSQENLIREYAEKIADLESMQRGMLSSFDFEEKD